MEQNMLDVTKGFIYELRDEMFIISNTDKDGLTKFNEIRYKLDCIKNYVDLMKDVTDLDIFKDLNTLVNKTNDELLNIMAYHNGYQQALRDMKEGK